jgi:WhiB family redox-sensing transcriptional regulator
MITKTAQEIHRLIAVIEDREWTEFARCKGRLDLFFEPFRELAPQRAIREQAAKELCARCPVQAACRDSGRRNHESGIWGAETEEDRVRAGYPIRTITRTSTATARQPVNATNGPPPPARDSEVA